jgi:exopolyphosphatase / guanosine-5'-triphosphate,3'-diphosphate pyrophosphatase
MEMDVVQMKIAVIDCGTNTFNLIIAEEKENSWSTLFTSKLPVKLGAGGFESKTILPGRYVRGLDALAAHAANIKNFEVTKVFAFATSALREAGNGTTFIEDAKRVTGIDVVLIDGNEEAQLIYEGILQTTTLGSQPSLIMDIGGGSTEFIIANEKGVLWKQSFLLGVSRLYDQLKPADRMTHEDVHRLRNVLDKQLAPLKAALKEYPCAQLIGSSGSFDTLLDLYLKSAKGIDPDFRPGLFNEIPMKAFPALHAWLMGSTFEERLKHPAIPALRAEYMPLASYLVKFIVEQQPFTHLFHSAYSLKEGAMKRCLTA